MPEANSIRETNGGNKLEVSGDNFKMEFDAEDGTMYVRMSGAMVTSYRDLTIYDYFARFAHDYDENTQGRIINWVQDHKEAFVENNRLHQLRGDMQQRFRFDGYFYHDEAQRLAAPWLEEHELDYPGIQEDFVDWLGQEITWDVSEEDALNTALEEVEEEMRDEVKYDGLEALVDEDWMAMIHERFRNAVYGEISDLGYDMWAKFDQFIEEEKGGFTQYRVRYRKDRWEVVNQDKMQKPIKTGGKREVAKKAKQMAENKSPSIVYIEDKEGNLDDSKMVME